MKFVLLLINVNNYINSRSFLQLDPTLLYSKHAVLHKDNSITFSIFLSLRSRSVAWQPGGGRLPIGSDRAAGTAQCIRILVRSTFAFHYGVSGHQTRRDIWNLRCSHCLHSLSSLSLSFPSLHSRGHKNTLERSPSNKEETSFKAFEALFPLSLM